METEIIVIDDTIKNETVSSLSKSVGDILIAHEYPTEVANCAALFIEEIALTILEKNKNLKKPIMVETSIFFEKAYLMTTGYNRNMIRFLRHA